MLRPAGEHGRRSELHACQTKVTRARHAEDARAHPRCCVAQRRSGGVGAAELSSRGSPGHGHNVQLSYGSGWRSQAVDPQLVGGADATQDGHNTTRLPWRRAVMHGPGQWLTAQELTPQHDYGGSGPVPPGWRRRGARALGLVRLHVGKSRAWPGRADRTQKCMRQCGRSRARRRNESFAPTPNFSCLHWLVRHRAEIISQRRNGFLLFLSLSSLNELPH